jgi:hypothetical protein
MIWLAWRQFRAQAITAAAALAAFAILLVATGPGLASRYTASGRGVPGGRSPGLAQYRACQMIGCSPDWVTAYPAPVSTPPTALSAVSC